MEEKTKVKVSKFLASKLKTLTEEKRIGNIHYNDEKDIELLKKAIFELAQTIYE